MLNGWNYQGDWEWINLLAKTALHIEKGPRHGFNA